ncbi:MAG: hypothetical protein KF763_17280 [Cyclobacteriaceae bacterium]|nr:hypothetical protein [Cyclobacteriaceae bacterium]
MIAHTTYHNSQHALKMNGAFIKLTPEDFQNLLNRNEGLAVVTTITTFFGTTFTYVTSHKGLIFFCKTKSQLSVSNRHETILAQSITLPAL